jgi:DNA-binding PadR family transcriptional regulator
VLYSALKFLEDEEMVTGYWKKVEVEVVPVDIRFAP